VADAQDAKPPWAIKFTHKSLDVITVPYKNGDAVTHYYMLFKLENKGATDAPLGIHFKALVGSNPRTQETFYATPHATAEEFVRRLSRSSKLKSVQQINKMKTLKKGQSVEGIAVFGTFSREWDISTVMVSGLEPHGLICRVRKYEGAGFTVAHGAYGRHNAAVLKAAGENPEFTEANAIVRHEIVWRMRFHREGDEYSPHLDPIYLDKEEWDVVSKPAPKIEMELEAPFKG
jgi:hypothetical protein